MRKTLLNLPFPEPGCLQLGTDALCTVGNYFTDCPAVMFSAGFLGLYTVMVITDPSALP